MNILVIDDNEEITEVISFYCKNKNIDCQVINNGREGLEAIVSSNEFDLILLDIAMPDFTGIDVINTLKEDDIVKSKNIVVITASSDRKLLEELEKSGVNGILKKPCSLEELTELIDQYRKTE